MIVSCHCLQNELDSGWECGGVMLLVHAKLVMIRVLVYTRAWLSPQDTAIQVYILTCEVHETGNMFGFGG